MRNIKWKINTNPDAITKMDRLKELISTAKRAKADEDKKVDMMAAVRPYQDALINAKIDNVALVGDFNLARRTCKMITGELVLPSTPTVTGYASYNPCNPQPASTGA